MGYRGDDLDLRTPQAQSSTPLDAGTWRDADAGAPRSRPHHGGALNGPIWVDETVLACCNHAYDVALAHGATDVRLEHFLHALTRIDAAAEALEARGVRVAALRRESATVIASEIPSSSAKTLGSPRRTQELEDVMRLAAAQGARRDEPATIDDVVHVIIDEEPDLPGLSLLQRRPARRTMPFETLPSLPRASYGEGRNYLNEPGRSRYRLASQSSYLSESGNGHGSGRIDGLEHAVNSLIGEISSDRKAFAGALQELQREAIAQRDELADGFHALNQAVHSVRTQSTDLTPPLSSISKRLEAIEDVITARTEDHGAQIADRLARLEDALGKSQSRATEQHDGVLRELAQVTSRFSGALVPVAERIEKQRSEIVTAVLAPLAERIDRLEKLSQAADSHEARASQALTIVSDRLTQLERNLTDWAQTTAQAGATYAKELGEIEEVLVKMSDGQRAVSGSVGAWRQEGVSALSAMASRLDTVEIHGVRATGLLEQLSGVMERMHQLTAHRYLRRNRIKYWLFGTDDWITASWPSQVSKITEAMERVKTERA